MPQRTNDYQDLVLQVQKAFAREGDTVEESVMAPEQGTGTDREIDILITTSSGPYKIKIAVEAKDEARKIDLGTFDALVGRYRGEGRVLVDKLVIVSASGFAKTVEKKAKLLDVLLVTLREAKDFDWTTLGPEHAKLQHMKEMKVQVAPHIRAIIVTPQLPVMMEKMILQQGLVLCPTCKDGRNHGTVQAFARLHSIERRDPAMVAKMREVQSLLYKHPIIDLNVVLGPMPFRILFQGVEYPLHKLHVVIHTENHTGPATCTPFQMTGPDGTVQHLHRVTADVAGMKYSFLMPNGLKSKKIIFSSKHLNSKKEKTPKERAEERKKQRRKQSRAKNKRKK